MLPHLADRPLTMIRMPDGIGGQRFFQKHWEQARPDVRRERHGVLRAQGRAARVPAVQQPADAAVARAVGHARVSRLAFAREGRCRTRRGKGTDYASSLEALEASVLNYPDYVLFDIDPYIYSGKEAKGAEPELNTVAFEKGKEVAFWLRELLREHVARGDREDVRARPACTCSCPIQRTIDFDAARHVSRDWSGRHLMRLHPKDITLEWSDAQAHRQDLHGLQHERPRQDAERRVFAARRARRAGLDAADLGGTARRATRWTSRSRTRRGALGQRPATAGMISLSRQAEALRTRFRK